ncbi:glutamate racemase [Thalassolituus sp.]|uniref:glutamate racemase n=1 Tax=Thalassolituus sp. TaxID=2030822 RepID=UPI002A7EE3B9|nr:glutamate racemase [Thalassolituus sp.]
MKHTVLIFDSGVGGLSILQEVRQLLPNLKLSYLMDNAAFPYGIQPDDILLRRIVNVCRSAVEVLQPDLLIIACNTASTIALPALREQLAIPVVGVVPAIKLAANSAHGGHIGLLATPATINRTYTDDLITQFASGCTVHRFGSSELVLLAEEFMLGHDVDRAVIDHIGKWIDSTPTMTHIVLGCTHFPLLTPLLQTQWPKIQWTDSGTAIARRVKQLLPVTADDTQSGDLQLSWTAANQMPSAAENFLSQMGSIAHAAPLLVKEFSYT